jgi:hypothetical protein
VSRHFDDFDAVLEFDALDDFGQLIFALQLSPRFPFVRTVRCRTVANTLSIGFDVRR